MALEVRGIEQDEMAAWVASLQVPFHVQRPADEEAAYRLESGQLVERTLAGLDDGRIVGTLESFPVALSVPGGAALTADAISAVSVLPTYRRRGLLTALMRHDLQAAHELGEPASILIAAEYPIYGRFGYGPAVEHVTYQIERAAAHFNRAALGRVELVEPTRMRQLAPDIFDRFRRDRPGQISRSHSTTWDRRLGLRVPPWMRDQKPPRCGLYTGPSGEAEGYVLYRTDLRWEQHLPASTLEIIELIALTADAYLGLWRYCCEIDLVKEVSADMRCADEPLPWLLDNPRAAVHQALRADLLWLRLLDVPSALAARRYPCEAQLVLDVRDPLGLCTGRFVLHGGPDGATCHATAEPADLSLDTRALGAIFLGGVSLRTLAWGGVIEEHRPGALDTGERLFRWPVTPWCSTMF